MRRLLAILLLFPAFSFAAEDSQPLPDVKVLAEKVLAKAKAIEQKNVWGSFTYTVDSTDIEYDGDGNEKSRNVRLRRYEPVDGRPFGFLVTRNGAPPTEDDLKAQEKKLAEHKKRQADRKAGKKSAEDRELNKEIMDRFDYTLDKREVMEGRPAFLITVKPKAGPKPEPSQADKVVNRLAGRVWVDEADNEIVRADVYLTEPVSFYLGLGNVRAIRVQYQAQKVNNEVWMPKTLQVEIEGRKLFSNIRQRTSQVYSNYQQAKGTSASEKP